MTSDHLNAMFELTGGCMLAMNCWTLYKDKQVKGVSLLAPLFFTTWGLFNMYFYPSNGHYWSFFAGLPIAFFNCLWLIMAVQYKLKAVN